MRREFLLSGDMSTLNPAPAPAIALPEFPMQRTCPFQPPPGYAALREDGPLTKVALFDGTAAWLVTSHAVARALLTDPRVSSDWTDPAFPVLSPVRGVIQKQNVMIGMDAPDHTLYRRMVIPAFTARRINTLRETLGQIVDERLTALLAQDGPVDLVGFAVSVPSIAICGLLGVPYDEHDFFEEETRKLVLRTSAEEAGAALGNLQRFLDDLIGRKLADPGEGLIDDLISGPYADGRIDRPMMVQMCTLMLMAGHETTANVILLGLLTLLENPDEFAALRADPDLVPSAVEEMLRYHGPIEISFPRFAAEDTEIAGQPIAKGDMVIAVLAAADRDPARFENPDTLDIRRQANRHLAFGRGAHMCLGAPLARVEGQVAITTLLARMPDLRAAVELDDVAWRPGFTLRGLSSLPVAF